MSRVFVNYAGRIDRLRLEAGVDLLRFDYHEVTIANVLASPQRLDAVRRERPRGLIVTYSIQERLTARAFMIPGIGDFGDGFFRTVHAGPPR